MPNSDVQGEGMRRACRTDGTQLEVVSDQDSLNCLA